MQILLIWHAIDLYLTSFMSTSDIMILLYVCEVVCQSLENVYQTE